LRSDRARRRSISGGSMRNPSDGSYETRGRYGPQTRPADQRAGDGGSASATSPSVCRSGTLSCRASMLFGVGGGPDSRAIAIVANRSPAERPGDDECDHAIASTPGPRLRRMQVSAYWWPDRADAYAVPRQVAHVRPNGQAQTRSAAELAMRRVGGALFHGRRQSRPQCRTGDNTGVPDPT
jgi:hypothetical protein